MTTAIRQTKTQTVENYFRKRILDGNLKAGDKIPTEASIRTKFKVGNSTVREAIGILVNDGLLERKQGAGTYVKKTSVLPSMGIVANLDMLANSACVYYHALLNRIQNILKQNGFQSVLLIGNSSDAEDFIKSTHLCNQNILKQIAGVISVVELGEIADYLDRNGIPHVSIIHHHNRGTGYAVELDYREMIRLGVGEFFDTGVEDIAIFICEGDDELQNRRSRGRLLRWFRECGLILPEKWIIGIPRTELETAYNAMKSLWESNNRPEAIFFLDDLICEVALKAITDLNISIPGELSLITASNVSKKFIFPVELTQIQFDPIGIADLGWNMLHKLSIQKKPEKLVEMVRPILIPGQSVS